MATESVANTARDEVLRRIRASKGGSADASAAESGWQTLPRLYRRTATLDLEEKLELLEDRLRDYDAKVVRATSPELTARVAEMLAERKVRRMAVPVGLDPEWMPEGIEFVDDEELTAAELDRLDGVITGAAVAIAETGTVVLQNVPGQGRRVATLVPDYHLCIVRVEDVVETVPEAMDRLQATATLPTTFISGPSATADIEMTRIKGVHGPRFLDVILLFT
jgi:L-lactate dehydrogenase complex protein LldG